MRVAELVQQRSFCLKQGSLQDPGPGHVQVRVQAVGVCGSDLHYFSEGGIGDVACVFPMVLGHEPAGVIVKTGPGVAGWAPGDKALLEPAIYCYHCEYCLTGHHNVCNSLRFLSQPGDPGFFRDFVNLPAHNLLPLPPGLSFSQATLFEPLAVILHSMKFAALRPGETAAVFGAGPIGLLTIALLKLSGASRIWAVEPVAHRRSLALALGAAVAIDSASVEPARVILQDTGNRGVDVAIDCAAKGGSINQAVRATRQAGRVVITGIPSETSLELDFHELRRKELAFLPVRRSNHETDVALHLLRDKPECFLPMITHNRPLERVQPSFEMLECYEDGVGKLVIELA